MKKFIENNRNIFENKEVTATVGQNISAYTFSGGNSWVYYSGVLHFETPGIVRICTPYGDVYFKLENIQSIRLDKKDK